MTLKNCILRLFFFSLSLLIPTVLPAAGKLPKTAPRALLKVTTYDASGNRLHEGIGFFIDESGTALAPFALFDKAARAEAVTVKGERLDVTRILGAGSLYDMVKFRVAVKKGKTVCLPLAHNAAATGTELALLRYLPGGKYDGSTAYIVKSDDFENYKYYGTSAPNDSTTFGCPLVNSETGEAVAIVQRNTLKDATGACAIDVRFANELTIGSTASLQRDLRSILIPKALPEKREDALTYIYTMSVADSLQRAAALTDYIAAFPADAEGYVNLAAFEAQGKHWAKCDELFGKALALAAEAKDSTMKADAVHYNYSKLIYAAAIEQKDTTNGWTLARAADEARAAYAALPEPLYLVQEGNCRFAQKDYAAAHGLYLEACRDKAFASAATFFSAARALELSGGDSAQVIALLDSTVAHIPLPCSARDAQYYLERSQRLVRAGRFRDAVADYNVYEQVIGPRNLNDKFYYLREQAELQGRMYQQALDDIRSAISANPAEPYYALEELLILIRTAQFEEAYTQAAALLKRLPDDADCHKFYGIACIETGRRAEGMEHLQKARTLGDATIDAILENYK